MTACTHPTKGPEAAEPYRTRADELAAFILKWMVNDAPAFRRSLPPRRRRTGAAFEMIGRASTHADLLKHFRSSDGGNLIGLPSVSSAGNCRWLSLSFLGNGSRDGTATLLQRIYRDLAVLGLRPLSFAGPLLAQVMVLFEDPVPAEKMHRAATWLVRGWEALGVAPPLISPRRPDLVPLGVTCVAPLFGRSPVSDQWPRLMTPEQEDLAGDELIDFVLAETPHPASAIARFDRLMAMKRYP